MKPVKCPTCKNEGDWFSGRYGPFCSRRCKLVDLGRWLNEEVKISEPLRPDHFSGFEQMPASDKLDEPDEDSR